VHGTGRPLDYGILAVSIGLAAAVFVADLALPLGLAIAVPYVIPVLLGLWSSRREHPLGFTVVGIVLTIVAVLVKHYAVAPDWVVWANRGLSIVALLATAIVVTVEHDTRAKAEQSRRQLEDTRTALDQAAIVCVSDADGRIARVNDKFCEISGYSREELVGSEHRISRSGVHPPEYFRDMWSTISSGKVWRGELCNRAKDGHRYWVDTTIVPFLGADGRPWQFLSIQTDITERKRVEQEMARKEALAQLGEMSAIIAHEVKNPLAGMSGALQVIATRLPAEGQERRIIGDILERIRSLNLSLHDLLTFAQPREPVCEAADVRALVGRAADRLASEARLGTLKIEIVGDGVVHGDPALLEEVFHDLLVNAAQAMKATGTVRVTLQPLQSAVRILVDDEGPGIPEELRDKVLQPFFTTRTRGTGLGLAVVKRTIDMHRGSLVVDAAPSGGARFVIDLPRAA
jgi:PAS domain S-box-containing protein